MRDEFDDQEFHERQRSEREARNRPSSVHCLSCLDGRDSGMKGWIDLTPDAPATHDLTPCRTCDPEHPLHHQATSWLAYQPPADAVPMPADFRSRFLVRS